MATPKDALSSMIEEVRRLDQAATPGPWELQREELDADFSDEEQDRAFFSHIGPWSVEWHELLNDQSAERIEADATLITTYRTATPALAEHAERLSRELEQQRAINKEIAERCNAAEQALLIARAELEIERGVLAALRVQRGRA